MDKTRKEGYVFGKENYMILWIGIAIIVIGFLLMIGGGAEDPAGFSEEIFSTRRLTVAPMAVLSGFAVIFFAILCSCERG